MMGARFIVIFALPAKIFIVVKMSFVVKPFTRVNMIIMKVRSSASGTSSRC